MAKIISLAAMRSRRELKSSQHHVESEFQRVRKTLNRKDNLLPSEVPTTDEWSMLAVVRGIMEAALRDGDWILARQRIVKLKRRAGIRIVQAR